MFELLNRISNHLEFLMDCTIEPSSVRESTQNLIDEIKSALSDPKSNGDKIRGMTDEELADFLDTITDCCHAYVPKCENCPMKYKDTAPYCNISLWLKQEAKDDAG